MSQKSCDGCDWTAWIHLFLALILYKCRVLCLYDEILITYDVQLYFPLGTTSFTHVVLCLQYDFTDKYCCTTAMLLWFHVSPRGLGTWTCKTLKHCTVLLQQQLMWGSQFDMVRTRIQHNYLGSFVDFVLVAPLVNKHGSGFSILEHRWVHGESGGQGQEWLLQGTTPHRAAFRAHGRTYSWTWRAMTGTAGRKPHKPNVVCGNAKLSVVNHANTNTYYRATLTYWYLFHCVGCTAPVWEVSLCC